MDEITVTQVQYVRCIKPNANKSSLIFDRAMVMEQLRCAGMIEAIRISRAAYPYRLLHRDFLDRFGRLRPRLMRDLTDLTANSEKRCRALLESVCPSNALPKQPSAIQVR
jgi:myosin-5